MGDLITPPREVYKYWQTSPLEVVIFFAGVFVSIFTSIENGIYVTVAASAAVLLFRIAKSPGRFLGRVDTLAAPRDAVVRIKSHSSSDLARETDSLIGGEKPSHAAYITLDRSDLSNPQADIKSPYPGVFIYRFGEGLNYVNSARHLDTLTIYIFKHTRRTQLDKYGKVGDRPWNDPGPRRGEASRLNEELATRPILRAVVLDFTAVNFLDVTAAQALVDLRNQFDRYADPERVEWHFAGVANRWTKRALVASGFGVERVQQRVEGVDPERGLKDAAAPLIALAQVAGPEGSASRKAVVAGKGKADEARSEANEVDGEGEEVSPATSTGGHSVGGGGGRFVPLYGVNRPFFHVDVETAVASAVRSLERKTADSSV